MYSTFEMSRNVLPLACMVSFHALKAVILMLLSTGSAKSVSLPFYRNRFLELFYLYPDNAPTIMFLYLVTWKSEKSLFQEIYTFFEHAILKNMTVCSVWYFSIPVFYYIILSTKYHMIDLENVFLVITAKNKKKQSKKFQWFPLKY